MGAQERLPEDVARYVSARPGSYRTDCSECSKRKGDQTRGVTVEPGGSMVYHCHRCGDSGNYAPQSGVTYGQPRQSRPTPAQKQTQAPDQMAKDLRGCKPITTDVPAGRYQMRRRCFVPTAHDLYAHSHLYHGRSKSTWPAMVAVITDIHTLEPISLHKTFLTHDGQKAPVEGQRLYLYGGRKQGGVVRLSPDDEVTHGLTIGEGLETCLTALANGFGPVWCCLDAGNLAAFPVLGGIETLTVLVDDDPAGHKAYEEVRQRWEAAGREVLHMLEPGGDLNDWATAHGCP